MLSSAKEGSAGSSSSMGAHLLSKLTSRNADSKIGEEIRRNIRGGRRSKGEPSEIDESIKKAQEEAVVIDITLAKLKNEKEGLLRTIADFRVKERMLVESGRTDEVNAIRKAIVGAQNEVDKINGVIPESTALEDHKKIQSIVSEWYAEKENVAKATKKINDAEEILKANPSDGRVLGDAIRGEAEKAEARERLAVAEHEAELILEKQTPSPVRDGGIKHTNEEAIEERKFLNNRRSERVAPGIFGLKKENEEMQKEMNELATSASEVSTQQPSEPATINETSVEEKNMKQEMPPLEFTMEEKPNMEDERFKGAQALKEEMLARQTELDGKTDTESVAEKADIMQALSAIDKNITVMKEPKPLQSAYDVAMDRLWKENEAKRNATLGKTNEETIVSSESAPEPEDDSLLPIITESVEEVVGTPREGQEVAFEKFENIAGAENMVTREQVLAKIAKLGEMAEARAEEKKVPDGWLRRVGETWNKVPTRYKILLTAGMVASGIGSAAVGATTAIGAIAVIGAGLRAIGGAGLFVAIEKGLKIRAERKGDKRSGVEEFRDTTVAAALSIVIVGVLPNMARDYAVEHGLFQKISDFLGFGGAHVEARIEAPVESGEYIQIAKSGDSVWKMAGNIVVEKFPDLSPEQKTYVIDAIKDRIEKYPESYGLTDANNITVGEGVDFGGIFGDKEFMDNTLSSAKNLTPENVANIQNYGNETPVRTMSAEEFLSEPLHTTFTPEEATPVIPPQVIPTPEQAVATPEVPPKDVLMENYVPPMPQEIIPGNSAYATQIEAISNSALHDDMNELLGKKPNIFGFGGVDGLESKDWTDPEVGFGSKTVGEIMSARANTPLSPLQKPIGINNPVLLDEIQKYIMNAGKVSGVEVKIDSSQKLDGLVRSATIAELSK